MKLTARNYHSRAANREYMSTSQFKAFEKCPAAAIAEINGKYKREKTVALLVGSYVDAYFEGTLDAFRKSTPEIFKRDGTLKADFMQADDIIRRIEKDRYFMKQLSGEKQVIMTGEIKGVRVKIKIDSLLPDKIVDLKIVRDFEPMRVPDRGLLPWFEAWGYDMQGAIYQEIVRQNIGKRLPFELAAATKEKITDIDVINLGQHHLDFALERVEQNIEMYDAMKQRIVTPDRCEKCEYCKMSKRLKASTDAEIYYM